MLQFPFNEVEGLVTENDKLTLQSLACECAVLPGIFVEIGSYRGLSALCILSGAPKAKLLCFDIFDPVNIGTFKSGIEEAGFTANVQVVIGDFKETIGALNDDVAFAFIDHDHTKESTVMAYDHLWPRMVKDGLLLFHDFRNFAYSEPTGFLEALPNRHAISGGIIVFKKP